MNARNDVGNSAKSLVEKCSSCIGKGRKMYGSTATYMHGDGMVAASAMTEDYCDVCWGSGLQSHPGVNLREVYTSQNTVLDQWRKHSRKISAESARYKCALENIAKQLLEEEMCDEDWAHADFEGAHREMILVARRGLEEPRPAFEFLSKINAGAVGDSPDERMVETKGEE